MIFLDGLPSFIIYLFYDGDFHYLVQLQNKTFVTVSAA